MGSGAAAAGAAATPGAAASRGAARSITSTALSSCFFPSSYSSKSFASRPARGWPSLPRTVTGISMTTALARSWTVDWGDAGTARRARRRTRTPRRRMTAVVSSHARHRPRPAVPRHQTRGRNTRHRCLGAGLAPPGQQITTVFDSRPGGPRAAPTAPDENAGGAIAFAPHDPRPPPRVQRRIHRREIPHLQAPALRARRDGDPVPPGGDAVLPPAGAARRDGLGLARHLPAALDARGAAPLARRRAAAPRRARQRRIPGLRRRRLRRHAGLERQARAEADRAAGLPDALRLPGCAVRGAFADVPGRRQARLESLRPRHRRLQARRRRGDPLRPRARKKSSCSTSTRRARRPRSTSRSPNSSGA